jgi:predicted bacteriocin transport accessory protein
MKKKLMYILIFLLVVGIFVIFFIANKTSNKNSASDNVVFIDVSTLEKKIENKDTFVLVLTQDGCSHCQNYAPVLESVAEKYNFKIYDLNLTNVDSSEVSRLNKIANVSGTPTTIFYKDGEEETTLNRISGETTEDKLVAKLIKLGYIEGE